MDIVFVTPTMKTGGGNRVFIELANLLCHDNSVWILAPNNSADKHSFEQDVRVKSESVGRLAKGKFKKVCNILKTIRFLNKYHQGKIIICSDPLFCLFLFLIRCDNLFRFIQADDYRIYDDGGVLGQGFVFRMYKKICLSSYRNKRVRFMFNSIYVYENYCRDSQRKDTPFRLVHPALNLNIFNPQGRSENESKNVSICLVARKHPLKGLINFINVWRELEQEHKDKVKRIVLVSHDDLSEFDTRGIDIVVPKSDKDIADVYRSSEIFISTSWWEGFGLPPLEAMACGCAVISSAAGGVNEYARKDKNCLMFEPRNEMALKQSLIRMIEDKDLRNRLAANGIKTAKNFTWQTSVKQLLELIEK